MSPDTARIYAGLGLRVEQFEAVGEPVHERINQLSEQERAVLTPISPELPTIGPGTLALLRKHDVRFAFDVLKKPRPAVEGVGPARWAVLEEWAREQARDRASLEAREPLHMARWAYQSLAAAREVFTAYGHSARKAELFLAPASQAASELDLASRLRTDALGRCTAVARHGIVAPLAAFLDWDATFVGAARERERLEQKKVRNAKIRKVATWVFFGLVVLLSGACCLIANRDPPPADPSLSSVPVVRYNTAPPPPEPVPPPRPRSSSHRSPAADPPADPPPSGAAAPPEEPSSRRHRRHHSH